MGPTQELWFLTLLDGSFPQGHVSGPWPSPPGLFPSLPLSLHIQAGSGDSCLCPSLSLLSPNWAAPNCKVSVFSGLGLIEASLFSV